jgi:hypothetical protein
MIIYNLFRFLVTFIGAGDVKPIVVKPNAAAVLAGCTATTEEFLKGVKNSFTIQPKQVQNNEYNV